MLLFENQAIGDAAPGRRTEALLHDAGNMRVGSLLQRFEAFLVEPVGREAVALIADQALDLALGISCRLHPMRIISNDIFKSPILFTHCLDGSSRWSTIASVGGRIGFSTWMKERICGRCRRDGRARSWTIPLS